MAALGLELGEALAHAVLVDEQGCVQARADVSAGPVSLAEAAIAAVSRVLDAVGVTVAPGLGIAASDPDGALVRDAVTALRTRWSVPPGAVSNSGAAGAVGEAWCGAARGARHTVFLGIGDVVAAGILVDGRLWSGAHGLAGSVAWLALNPVERQDYRRYGCLAAEVGARGIARRLVWRVEAGDHSAVVDRVGGDLTAVTAAAVFAGAREGDGVAISVVRDTARYVGMAVANLATILDPELIVLGGLVADAADLLLGPVRQEAERRVSPALAGRLRIEPSALAGDAAAVGAARLAMIASS